MLINSKQYKQHFFNMSEEGKAVVWGVTIGLAIAIGAFCYAAFGPHTKETLYCGTVTEKFRTDAGYKSSPQAHVVFYCDSLKRNIDVQVTWNCYANTEPGEPICFSLRDRDIND